MEVSVGVRIGVVECQLIAADVARSHGLCVEPIEMPCETRVGPVKLVLGEVQFTPGKGALLRRCRQNFPDDDSACC